MIKRHIVLHHSLTADGETLSWPAIRRYHVEVQRWRDIGYHFGVERYDHPAEHVAKGFEWLGGRPWDERAAAVREDSLNSSGIHVCFVGNFDEEPPAREALQLAARHLLPLMGALDIPLELARRHGTGRGAFWTPGVLGHRDASTKTCPGREFSIPAFLAELRAL